ncbi:MAG TPA: hypothetical protein VG073_06005, partial [Gaiellaceae bacterium]|nr:hypothetical protein [Gaiellaceae bacterium]
MRTLTPAASAAAASVQPCTPTRSTAKRRLCGQVLALPCNLNIRIPSLELVAWQLQPPRRPGWNNALRNYSALFLRVDRVCHDGFTSRRPTGGDGPATPTKTAAPSNSRVERVATLNDLGARHPARRDEPLGCPPPRPEAQPALSGSGLLDAST